MIPPSTGPSAEGDAALAAAEAVPEERQRGREHHRAADPLAAARQDQHERVDGDAAQQRAEREDGQPDCEQPLTAVPVGQRPRGQQQRGQR
jgi:hypothetical protein